ncbi:hypothetical protein CJ030_MR7G023883 [Morella rubra]|uniref:Gnk2-homologous domain-containing protein n=1 Tax=Morella rubra TaxID=262757 RepID=A0A6A1V6A2_9ROSI|nr:hypothetical protein CJ030_MR7G023883 [Morella rubra]
MQLANNSSVAPKMQVKSSTRFGESEVVSSIATCTRDLSSIDCAKCLRNSIAELHKCCAGKRATSVYRKVASIVGKVASTVGTIKALGNVRQLYACVRWEPVWQLLRGIKV